MKTSEMIKKQLAENPVILYMKGNPQFPMCGFSAAAVEAIQSTGTQFAFVNVLEQPRIRQGLPEVSEWPTFPQLFVNGELVGGADIIKDMNASGQLKTLLETAEPAAAE
jgi:monothiol glutaredoxin